MNPSPVELLAPAGSPESLVAALESGANAVYLGLKEFNARGNAINFSLDELAYYVPLAHEKGTKVYLTLNTLVKMEERAPLLRALAGASDCGIDGVILQDIGLGRTIARHFPHLRRHASTQLAVHNLEGVAFCVAEGFQRVVLARELTFAEIEEIRAAYPPDVIELEVFCHGAMCYTYSGMCFFSGSVGGRSGNRGECAYTCRKGYKIHNDTTFPMAAEKGSFRNYLFSMKDMNTLEILPQLLETGVDSLKIEGRRKGPAYVHAAVEAYRGRLQDGDTERQESDLKLSFGRDYTAAFYQRGQFGDHPVDLTATGSRGIHIGTIDGSGNAFRLLQTGIQRYDGLRLVAPDREETLMSFNKYDVSGGDRMRPARNTIVRLSQSFPKGTSVWWVRSQEVEQRYRPQKSLLDQQESGLPLPVDLFVEVGEGPAKGTLTIRAAHPYAQVTRQFETSPSKTGKGTPIKELMFRFGDSPFRPGSYHGPVAIDDFMPLSVLKKGRRAMLAELSEQTASARARWLEELVDQANRPVRAVPRAQAEPEFILRVDKLEQLAPVIELANQYEAGLDFVLRPTLSTPQWKEVLATLRTFAGPLRLSLPMVLRKWDLRVIRHRMKDLDEVPFDWVLANPGHFDLIEPCREGRRLHADFSVYHLNTWSVEALQDMGVDGRFTLSLEDDRPNMAALLAACDPTRFEAIAYTDTPLFVAEACSLAALYGGCPGAKTCCHETLFIENEHGDHFEVRHDRCRSTVVGDRALSWSGDLAWFRARGVRNFRLDFTVRDYRIEDIAQRFQRVRSDLPITNTHTENLDRILL